MMANSLMCGYRLARVSLKQTPLHTHTQRQRKMLFPKKIMDKHRSKCNQQQDARLVLIYKEKQKHSLSRVN